jgi:hypothetical protein
MDLTIPDATLQGNTKDWQTEAQSRRPLVTLGDWQVMRLGAIHRFRNLSA